VKKEEMRSGDERGRRETEMRGDRRTGESEKGKV
jgi:hypothetical protein